MSSTVFVLGAGFSAPANMPVQADLMREIVKRASQQKVRDTVGAMFNLFEVGDMARVPLEDIFTMLDRALNARETIPGFTREQLEDSYRLLITSITAEFQRRLSSFPTAPYAAFVSELVKRRVGDGSEEAQ